MRESNAIAKREFPNFAKRYSMQRMKTTPEIRRDNLLLLIAKYGTAADLNDALGKARTDATLSQIKNRSRDSKTGVPKAMGTTQARKIEKLLSLEAGWMDHPHEDLQTGSVAKEALENQWPDAPQNQLSALVDLASVMKALSDQFLRMDPATREMAVGLIGNMAKAPDTHATVAAMLEVAVSAPMIKRA